MVKTRVFCFLLSAVLLAVTLVLPASAYAHDATKPLPAGVYRSWKQTDPRWSELVIGVDPWTDSSGVHHSYETVGHAGCLITSMAILARGYGLTLRDGTMINPGTLATALYDNGSCTYLNERGATRYDTAFDRLIPGIHFEQYGQPSNAVSAARQLLSDPDKEYLILFGVRQNGHYVALDHIEGSDAVICDPGYDRTLLSEYRVSCMLVYSVDAELLGTDTPAPSEQLWRVVETAGIKLRKTPGLSGERVGVLYYDQVFAVYETLEEDGYLWGRTDNGWCALHKLDLSEILCVREEVATYPVQYHANGGSGVPEIQYKQEGLTLTLSDVIPTKEGSLFLGWSTDPSASSAEYVAGDRYEDDEALSLYAVWMAENEYFAFGIDVSKWQAEIDWEAVAADGIRFAILRAGTSGGKDEYFERNYVAAKAAGLYVGSYFYSYALTEEEAAEDAALFLKWLSGKEFEMPVYLDVETREQSNLPDGALNSVALAFLQPLREQGYFCGVYSSSNWFADRLDLELLGGREAGWVARWMNSGTLSQNMSEDFGMYQYSETGRVNGIEGAVDLDICYMDFPSLTQKENEKLPEPLADSGLTVQDGLLLGCPFDATAEQVQALFDGEVTLTNPDGEPLAQEDVVKTGYRILCGKRVYTLSVRGDLSGDGKIDAVDFFLLKRAYLGTASLSDAAYRAGCLTDEEICAVDYLILKRHVLGTFDIFTMTVIDPE